MKTNMKKTKMTDVEEEGEEWEEVDDDQTMIRR